MWRILEWPRLNLPVPVLVKRFAAPEWVFNFGRGDPERPRFFWTLRQVYIKSTINEVRLRPNIPCLSPSCEDRLMPDPTSYTYRDPILCLWQSAVRQVQLNRHAALAEASASGIRSLAAP